MSAPRHHAGRDALLPLGRRARLHVQGGARLEWLPLENIAFPSCRTDNAEHAG